MSVQLRAAAVAIGVLVVAAVAYILLSQREEIPGIKAVFGPKTCPLTGLEPQDESLLQRPAVGVKVENHPVAYPLSGLERAEVVYEEPVEGGLTRFLALYHCNDSGKVGPVRSSRTIDPAIMTPVTHILGAAGGNAIVRRALDKRDIVLVGEGDTAGGMRREERPGISSEHTLYADTAKLRKVGRRRFDRPPPDDLYSFGELDGRARKASSVTITFSGAVTVTYRWSRRGWLRFEDGERFVSEKGGQIAVDNVIVEEHEVNLSKKIVDVAGNPSVEIADVTGSGRAMLFRDGRVVRGRWIRDALTDPIRFETNAGDDMVLRRGTTWIELVPSSKGEVKGSFDFER
jgi:hypothetical protein